MVGTVGITDARTKRFVSARMLVSVADVGVTIALWMMESVWAASWLALSWLGRFAVASSLVNWD